MSLKPVPNQTAWVIAANMGLGHQRAAYPLKNFGGGLVITAGSREFSTFKENKLWNRVQQIYEGISRINHLPILGRFLFGLLDRMESISPFYPFRDLSKPNFQTWYTSSLIKKGLGKTLIDKLSPIQPRLPIVTTYFAVALAADRLGFPLIYLVTTDTDIHRVWVAQNPAQSRIIYLAPCGHALGRLKEYGVPDQRIYLTGFPLPVENLGGPNLEILKSDLAQRLQYLDPRQRFRSLHRVEAEYYLGAENFQQKTDRILTLTFAVGGAGAQKEIGAEILTSLAKHIRNSRIRLNLVAGVRAEVKDYFLMHVRKLNLAAQLGTGIKILFHSKLDDYFQEFNLLLRRTDILWTKPSELSFYCALGIPIIIGPPLGSHEHFNKKWLIEHRAGIPQEDPSCCSEWLFDLLHQGLLAQAAWDGFLNTRKYGTFKIGELLKTGTMTRETSPLRR